MLVCQSVESNGILGKIQIHGFIACRENCSLASDADKQVSHFLKFACALSDFPLLLNKKIAVIALDTSEAMLHANSGLPHLPS